MIPANRFKQYLNSKIKVFVPGNVLEGTLIEVHNLSDYIVLESMNGLTRTEVAINTGTIVAVSQESIVNG